MTHSQEELELAKFHADQKVKKMAYCASLGLSCEINCPQDKTGCKFHPDHEKAIKEELVNYEG